jgi:hypothetical protein
MINIKNNSTILSRQSASNLKRNRTIYRCLCLLFIITVLISLVNFNSTIALASSNDQKVYDNAVIFTEEEIKDLEANC